MSPVIMSLITSFFMKKGKPNKVLEKLGEDVVGGILEGTLKDGKPTMSTLNTISELNSKSKSSRPSKEQKDALKRLAENKDYSPQMKDYVLHDMIFPALSGGIRTLGNVATAQKMIGPAAMAAVADSLKNKYTGNIGATTGGQVSNAVAAAIAPALHARKAADIAGIQGIANTTANVMDKYSAHKASEDAAARNRLYAKDAQTAAGGSAATEAQTNLINQQLKQNYDREKRLAGGGGWN